MADGQGAHPNVNFLIQTMMQRAPHKRRVKLVEKHLQQVEFDMGDSEEDSDFDIAQIAHELDSDGEMGEEERAEMLELAFSNIPTPSPVINLHNDDDDEKDDDDSDKSDEEDEDCNTDDEDEEEEEEDDDDEDDDDDEEDDEEDESDNNDIGVRKDKPKGLGGIFDGMETSDEEDEDYIPQKKKRKKGGGRGMTKGTKSKPAEPSKPPAPVNNGATAVTAQQGQGQDQQGQGQIKVLICCVCLSDKSADDDEIVECDNCGISVHEGCYGISDSQSCASTESSASTEPWFCDACKAGVDPHCELCPNSGGIYKETDAGKWVHIVCALYTPGVAFGDVDRLCPVTLFEMPYSKWGAKECSLCEDVRFSRTGVCISCDAGLCRSHFHVTCAQREGLLTEADPGEVMDIADPFFAYCKQHVDKATMRARRRHWLAIQSHVRSYMRKVIDDKKEQLRFERKLNRHREKYTIAKKKRPPSWVPTEKMVRHLHTSPHAVRSFMRKAELMGVVSHVEQAPHEKPEARKKPHITPAFSGEFIQYYFGRQNKIDELRKTMNELSGQNVKLRDQERVLRTQYEQLSRDLDKLQDGSSKTRRGGEELWTIMADIGGKAVTIPEMFRARKRQRSPSKKETVASPTPLIHQCGICHQTTDQHLLAKCDSCHHHFHLGCLDPPLTRMPKKSKLFGWQCSRCVTSTSDDSEASAGAVLMNAPRRLRETIKEPVKFRTMQLQNMEMRKKFSGKPKPKKKPVAPPSSDIQVASPAASTSSSSMKTKKKAETKKDENDDKTSPRWQSGRASRGKKEEKEEKGNYPDIMCVVCNLGGELDNTVRCDDCQLSYHFSCLDPPLRKSPKVRGYAWHCEACDTDLSEDFYIIEEEGHSKAG